MLGPIAYDARDAFRPMPHGSGIYARCLHDALRARDDIEIDAVLSDGPGPELLWEQVVIPARLRLRRPALVHSPNCFLPLRRPCPGVVSIHDLAFEAHPGDFAPRTGWKYRTFTRRAARSAQRIITGSAFTRDDLERRYGIDPGKVRVMPYAPALPVGRSESPPGPYLLYAGDLRPKKNLVRLVAAFRRLRGAGLPHRLVVAGADVGGRGAELAGDGVELLGRVPDSRLDALLRGADLLVHPALYEGFGLIVAEAMARGCPCALARAGALPETGGDAAEYFDPLDAGDVARAVTAALARVDELAAAGRARAAGWSWEDTAARTVDVYAEVI